MIAVQILGIPELYGDATGVCQATGSDRLSLATVGAPGACGDHINTDRLLYHRRYGIDMSPLVAAKINMHGHIKSPRRRCR